MENTILNKISQNNLLIVKYTPRKFDDLILHPVTKKKLLTYIKYEFKNSIFIGGSGSGKTITAKILSKNIIPKEYVSNIFLNLNASDDRGLNMINNIIIPFVNKKFIDFPIKLVVINEAHTITSKAQSLIASLMDKWVNCKFIFISNELNDISDTIQSRCYILFFPILSFEDIFDKLKHINSHEKMKLSDECLETVINITQNDLRQSINYLQVIKFIKEDKITPQIIYKLFDKPDIVMITNLLHHIKLKQKDELLKILNIVKKKGYSPNDVLLAILNFIIQFKKYDKILTLDFLINIYNIVSKYYIRVNKGTETWIQVFGCISECFI